MPRTISPEPAIASARRRLTAVDRPSLAVLAALAAWSVGALAFIALRAQVHGGSLTGIDGALAGGDQFLYLNFVRQAGEHVLIGNRYDLPPTRGVLLHPMYVISGALWRLGADLAVALLVWKVAAVAALFAGCRAYAARLLPAEGFARAAALVLALFFFSPLLPALDWTGTISGLSGFRFLLVSGEAMPAWQLWGYLHAAVAVALMPLCLLGFEAVVATRPLRRRTLALTTAGCLLVSWLHPWQGATLVLILAGLAVWDRRVRRMLPLLAPAVAIALPVAYYAILTRTDSAWRLDEVQNRVPHAPAWMLLGGLLPLVLPALLAVRGAGTDPQERMLRLWPVAALGVYFASDQFPYHALQGVSIPLAVLAVRGWSRLGLRRAAGVSAVALLTLPGVLYGFTTLRHSVQSNIAAYTLRGGERSALAYLEHARRPGGVLSTYYLGMTVPALTGRATWIGDFPWTPRFETRRAMSAALFDAQLAPPAARAMVRSIPATFLLAPCGSRLDAPRVLGPLVRNERRFGCATVYEVTSAG